MTLPSTKVMILLLVSNCFRCYGNLKLPLTYNAKRENKDAVPLGTINFLQRCLLNSFPHFIRPLSKSLNLIGCRDNMNGKFSNKSSAKKTINRIKVKLCINVYDISV